MLAGTPRPLGSSTRTSSRPSIHCENPAGTRTMEITSAAAAIHGFTDVTDNAGFTTQLL